MKVAIESHGCRLNQAEGDGLGRLLREAGHEVVDDVNDADFFVLNGCTVTHDADADARRRVRAVHRNNAAVKIVVTGCFANAHPELAAELPGVHTVLGNVEKDELAQVLDSTTGAGALIRLESLTRHRPGQRPRIASAPMAALPSATSGRRARAYLKVQDGCNYQCSFCIVPQVRGRSRSVSISEARSALRELVRDGRPEVALTGVHLGTWGWERGLRDTGLSGLVEALLCDVGGSRLRLGSLDPHELQPSLVELMRKEAPRLCRHLHLPVQSGDDGVLHAMRRAHRDSDLRERLPRVAEHVPGVAIGSDIIVGFPGEDERAFEASVALFDELPLHYAHVFTYSPRAGTHAATLHEDATLRVYPGVAKKRNATIRERVRRNWESFRRSQLEQALDVMVWRTRHKKSGQLVGLTDNYIKVEFEGGDELLGGRARVQLRRLEGERSFGELLEPG
jgi:threonylcarbamoyladenosine tRNA methylthiotransferase MtaB